MRTLVTKKLHACAAVAAATSMVQQSCIALAVTRDSRGAGGVVFVMEAAAGARDARLELY